MPFFQTENLTLDTQSELGAVLSLDVAGRPLNVFTRQVLADLGAAFDQLSGLTTLKLLVIRSAKPSGFMAGADLHQFTAVRSGEEAVALSVAGQQLFEKLANLPAPTVAVIQGPCLGGGLEFALACDYRLVIDHPKTQLGLPEIELGLLPGWGGTQRLPRVIGLEPALHVIVGRRRLNAREAFRWGLADALADGEPRGEVELARLAERALQQGKRSRESLPLRTWRQRLVESTPLGRWLLFRAFERVLRRRVPDDMPAPFEALEAVRVGLAEGMAAGLKRERQAIGRLAITKTCRNLVTLFILIENARKQTDMAQEQAEKPAASPIRRVGVVGAGTMGAGIAQLAALKGFEVVIQEINEAALDAGMRKIETLFHKAVERRLLSAEEARHKLAGIGRTTTWQGFAEVDLVVEAVIEELEKKREVFRELEKRTPPTTILATNTSSLSVRQLQEGLDHSQRVAGLHFFNPVHKMPLVEVVRAPGTEEAAIPTLCQWAASIGKTPVVVGDSPGFVVNRILMPYLNEAGLLVGEGMAIKRVDQVMRRFGMPLGPLELLDQVGLDVAAHISRAMGPLFGNRLAPHPGLDLMCRQGWLGQKSGAGFYLYRGKPKKVNGAALGLLPRDTRTSPTLMGKRNPGEERQEAQERMVLLMVNEAAACLAEGLAATADRIDLAMVLGTGWAPHRGGPLRYADDRGAGEVVTILEDLARRIGPRFEPCAELRRRAGAGEKFYSSLAIPQPA